MQLRKSITVPTRFEDEVHAASQNRNRTKPTSAMLLKAQVVPFNPNNPPAAFPSLRLTSGNTPAARNTEESEELVRNTEILSSLSNKGLGISFVGGNTDGGDILQAQRQLSVPITMQQDKTSLVESVPDGTIATATPSTSSEPEQNVAWGLLPLSLQHHIYRALAAEHPSTSVPRILGLTEHEATKIEEAVGLRVLHPASIAEIWDFCSKASVETSGCPQPSSYIDPDIFNEYVHYMVFASNYEVAFESEVRLAEDFLSSRGIATDLLGTWLPDPLDGQFDGFFKYVPGTTGKANLSNSNLDIHTDSGYSSFSEADQNHKVQRSPGRPRSRHDLSRQKTSGESSTVLLTAASSIHSIEHPLTTERKSINLDPSLVARTAPHSLATVTKFAELSSPAGDLWSDAREVDQEIGADVPPPDSHAIISTFNNSASGQDQCLQFEPPDDLTAAFGPRARGSSPSKSLVMVLLEYGEQSRDSESEGLSQGLVAFSADPSTAEMAPNPHRLVLKIQNKDGLAKISRKKPKPMDGAKENYLPNSADTTEVSLNGTPPSCGHSPLMCLLFETDMFGFSGNPMVTDVERLLPDGTAEVTFPGAATFPQASLETSNTKRKASRSDIRPDPSKVQRVLINVAPVTPSKAILQGHGGGIDRLHGEAKRSCELSAADVSLSRETNSPTESNHVIPSIEPADTLARMFENTALLDTMDPRSPLSPSYSPISENENSEEFQARLRGPMTRRMRVKVPGQEDNLSLQPDLALTLNSSLTFDFQSPLELSTPQPSGHDGENKIKLENHVTNNSKRLKIKLNCKEQSEEPSTSRSADPCLPSEQTQDNSHAVGNDVTRGRPSGQTSELGQHQPMLPTGARANREMKASSSTTTSGQTDMSTTEKETTQDKTLNKKKPGGQRGPRGPYKKTRERQARLAAEKANAEIVKKA
ncbi:uncharacterized protein Z519_03208 [Cladophialophora bantiana CBS 173.52]|uniref:Uncharacterized protein n=1 Tax=Cladophialophora bantiana (strain ATCC 10958 / CBS 173.52 / CDC B-1940 / NIH 8579) TaxID=1442370 RepID=A0A0D2F1R2_CLAB1|nr:uncharacterized protein Z519_03208 [Cladophialophora bantiana CBS 173.52]KIW96141.1 hypothetical protein Z519_03208 [Cladophialophora bantiana CBS 173.52]